MDRIFRIDFYPQDWLVKTGDLTPDECGLYIQIVSLIYAHRGPIENDPDEIGRKLKCCSVRLTKSIILSLIEKRKLYIIDGKLSQRRAEHELSMKRTHLENSAKGGRTKAENQPESNKNNNLTSSDASKSLSTPHPHPPLPLTSKERKEGKIPPEAPQGGQAGKIISAPEIDMLFQKFWNAYPGIGKYGLVGHAFKGSKEKARQIFQTLAKKENDHDAFTNRLLQACGQYEKHLADSGYPSRHATTWLNGKGWEDDYGSVAGPQPTRHSHPGQPKPYSHTILDAAERAEQQLRDNPRRRFNAEEAAAEIRALGNGNSDIPQAPSRIENHQRTPETSGDA